MQRLVPVIPTRLRRAPEADDEESVLGVGEGQILHYVQNDMKEKD